VLKKNNVLIFQAVVMVTILVVNALVLKQGPHGVLKLMLALLFLLIVLKIMTIVETVFALLPDSLGVLVKKLVSTFLIVV